MIEIINKGVVLADKVKFNEADSKEERKNIILDVRDDWKELVKKIMENARGQDAE